MHEAMTDKETRCHEVVLLENSFIPLNAMSAFCYSPGEQLRANRQEFKSLRLLTHTHTHTHTSTGKQCMTKHDSSVVTVRALGDKATASAGLQTHTDMSGVSAEGGDGTTAQLCQASLLHTQRKVAPHM